MRPRFPTEADSDLGNLALILLVGHLAGLRDRLALDGYYPAADLVADLVDITDDHLTHAREDDLCCSEERTVW